MSVLTMQLVSIYCHMNGIHESRPKGPCIELRGRPFGLSVDLRESFAKAVAKFILLCESFVQGWLANRKLE